MSKGQSLQDPFLNALIKLQGQVESFDQFVILLKNNICQMVYKHAISTIVPARAISNLNTGDSEKTE